MAKRKPKAIVVETALSDAEIATLKEDLANAPASEVTVLPPEPDLKTKVRKLIDEAPLLVEVKNNPWAYTEWLGKLNTIVLQA